MSEAKKLAKEIIDELYNPSFPLRTASIAKVETHLQPAFDLLAQIHKLAEDRTMRGGPLHEIEELTRKYDEGTK